MAKLLGGAVCLLLPALTVLFLQWRVPFSPPASAKETIYPQVKRLLQALPSTSGCWVRAPNGCPNQQAAAWVPTSSAWMQDFYGEETFNAGGDQSVCMYRRSQDFSAWCGSSVEMYFLAPQAPSTPGCWVRSPSKCPNQQPASNVPTSLAWMQDTYGEANLDAGGLQSVCEGRRRQDFNSWCGSSDTETYFVAQVLPTTPGCWVRSPSGCPNQQPASWVPTFSGWIQDVYGEASEDSGGDQSVCEGRRREDYNIWCGSSDTETFFVANSTDSNDPSMNATSTTTITTTQAVPSTPGCWVRAPSGCPSQPSASWVPTSSGWIQDAYGEANLNAAGSRSVCEDTRRQNYNLWCGASDIETYLVQTCLSKSTSTADDGWVDEYRGWYDVQGCGKCLDYCRWVGGTGSGGSPLDRTTMGDAFWSCRPAGGSETHSRYTSWSLGKCSGEGADAPATCSAFRTSLTCPTSRCAWRGNACEQAPSQYAVCRTSSYCYYASSVGASYGVASSSYAPCGWYYSAYSSMNCGSVPTCPTDSCIVQSGSGTPAVPSTPGCWVRSPSGCPSQPSASWVPTSSAWMQDAYGEANLNAAGSRSVCEDTRRQNYNLWCGSSDTETYFVPVTYTCMPKSISTLDAGYPDEFRGWYDVQGCGKCLDYCRWVGGNSGGGGRPTDSTTAEGGAFWSCRLAGGSETHSTFTSWSLPKCSGEGADAPYASS